MALSRPSSATIARTAGFSTAVSRARSTIQPAAAKQAHPIEASGGAIVKGPYNDAHERRAVVYDNKGNGLVFYSPLPG